ncbi:ATP-grasp domain-containing protein [Jatrophihabitans sp.]|jgi:glutathione synthase/RimK-type ligase-like ATP-grasp enzyme|uniref:ATP-grasp domain-containing protein n=1 Tax=Jatrophihabitans sp. TaxID=1932789 RepID=UPI002EED470E
MSSRIALASCLDMPTGDGDDLPLVKALTELGHQASMVPWDQPGVDWAAFDVTVIRATWDYTTRREEFLDWVASVPRLHNPAPVVVRNTDKSYLADLADAGLPVVATQLVPPGTEPELPESGEFVLKPSIGAGSRGAGRFDASRPGAHQQAREHAERLHAAGRTVLVQPYLDAVDTAGETALIFFDGVFSHAVRKGPMLRPDARHQVEGEALYVEENITRRTPSQAELAVAERVFSYANAGLPENLLYARIDLLPGPAGPVVVELELVEPSLFLLYADGAADRLAAAISARVN